MTTQYQEFEDTPLWRTLEAALDELIAQKAITVNTAPLYVVGHLCEQLKAQQLLSAKASAYDP